MSSSVDHTVWMVDYGAGNVRSLINAVERLGFHVKVVQSPKDIDNAHKLIFPGVGACGQCLTALEERGLSESLTKYLKSGKPYMGICIGMQTLFVESEETPGVKGLGIIPASVKKFRADDNKSVPHMGWNTVNQIQPNVGDDVLQRTQLISPTDFYYFVHSYAVPYSDDIKDWVYCTTKYGSETFVSAIRKGNVFATQFHPEKSGWAGLRVLKAFLECDFPSNKSVDSKLPEPRENKLSKRIIACLDVRANDNGDLVVTKGDQYDVREKEGDVRNLGKPVDLAKRYFEEGADEVTFLNITSFRDIPVKDTPMLEVLRRTSQTVFVPLTIGGGIRDITDPDGNFHSALDVAGEYFRSGADKVSIGSDAVLAAEEYFANGKKLTGKTSIEQIARGYGAQAVVISVDPRRVYVKSPELTTHKCVKTAELGPNGEEYCWWQCTIKGGREGRDLDVWQLITACEAMGAGEILLNCMDRDGTNRGYDLDLVTMAKSAVKIPVIASSGAGKPDHFVQVFEATDVDAALAAGIFHRREVPIASVKETCSKAGIVIRPDVAPL